MTRPPTGARPVRRAAAVVGLFLVAGALAGVVWELLWTPPSGIVLEGQFSLTSSGMTQTFGGTALYALIGGLGGLVLGAAAALRADGAELLTLAAVAVGALLAVPVMALVGVTLGPPDADEAARGQEDYTLLQQDLRVEGAGAYLAFPSGALLGAAGVFLALSRRGGDETGPSPDPRGGHRSGDDRGGAGDVEAPPR